MSAEASAWAKEQQCGDRTVKAVLREIANWARPDGVVEFLHIARIAAVVEVSPRTVKRCIAKLEEPTIEHPDRLGLIRRVARFRDDGGQSASGFELIGFQPPFDLPPGDKMSPPPVTHVTPPGDKMSREGVSPMSPLKRDKNNITPPPPKGGVPPQGCEAVAGDDVDDDGLAGGRGSPGAAPDRPEQRGKRARPLPDDFEPVLTPAAQRIVDGWPPGRFDAELRAFCDHAADKGRVSKDWQAAFRTWITKTDQWMKRDGELGTARAVSRTGAGGGSRDGFAAAIYRRLEADDADPDGSDRAGAFG